MTAPVTFLAETHERFIRAIVAQIPADRIIELHLFPAIKQGGVESGVVVLAALPPGDVSAAPSAAQEQVDTDPTPDVAAHLDEVPLESLTSEGDLPTGVPDAELEPRDPALETDTTIAADEMADAMAQIDQDDVDRLEEMVQDMSVDVEDDAARSMATASLEVGDLPPSDEPPRRYTIYSARYRLVLKGPDRGKWEVTVTAEADAPLLTLETVVRGVQRRSGDVEEVGRWSGEELRAALRLG